MALPIGGGLGVGGLVLLLLFSALTGQDPTALLPVDDGSTAIDGGAGTTGLKENDPQAEFISVVLRSTEEVWGELFQARRGQYEPPVLVLFTDATRSGCGVGQAAMGPFYCPADQRVYLDLSFFRDLAGRFGAPGEFAQAYVVAHEVGHHIQTLTGLSQRVANARQQSGATQSNALSVRQELQADCYAGVWGHFAAREGLVEPGDAEDGLRAAAAIGDDRLQRQSEGRVVPESFTHGSSEQRVSWLRRGLDTGRFDACDTFGSE
jgi:predicted metalloprotease